MSAFCPVAQLKRIIGEKEFPPEMERQGEYRLLTASSKTYLLPSNPLNLAFRDYRWLTRVNTRFFSLYDEEDLINKLSWERSLRDFFPLSIRHRLDNPVANTTELIKEALSRCDITLYEVRKPIKYHAPAKKLSMPLAEDIAPPPAQKGVPKPKTPTHWVEFCYQYEDNQKPISNVPFVLTLPDGSEINGMLPDNGKVRIEDIKKAGAATIAYGEPNAKQEADQLRKDIKQALDTIIKEERKEAAEIEDWFEDQNFIDRFYIRQFYLGKGIVNGAWGLMHWVGDLAEAVSAFGILDSMIQAGIKEKYDYQNDEWKQHFLDNFTEEHKKKVVKALGFDPSALTRENLAEAYETYVLIKSDPESKKIIWGFIKDYASAQHELELAEAGGELGFEFILAAVLAAFTGGTGAATLAPRLSAKMPKLGQKFRQLATAIKKVKLRKTTKGHTNKSTTTNVKRPEKKPLEPKKPSKLDFLRNFKYKGLQAQRIKEGDPDKIAVIGRSMSNPPDEPGVKEYAQALRSEGKSVEIFDGGIIPRSAKNDFQKRIEIKKLSDGKGWLSNEELLETKMYKANKKWAKKLQREGYTVIDIGNPYAKPKSVFYEMEKQIIF